MEYQEILSITIDHNEPLNLKKFTISMLAIERQYKKYLYLNGITGDEYNLYINEIKQGSVVIDFIKGKTWKLIENHVLKGFVESIKDKFEEVKKQKEIKDVRDIKDIKAISDVVSNHYSANFAINLNIGDQTTSNYNFNGMEANAIASECDRQLELKHEPKGELYRNVVLHWKSAADDKKSRGLDKGIIEEIDPQRKVKIICSEDLKQLMISENKENFFNMFFIVNVEVKRVSDKPVAYVILEIHDSGSIED